MGNYRAVGEKMGSIPPKMGPYCFCIIIVPVYPGLTKPFLFVKIVPDKQTEKQYKDLVVPCESESRSFSSYVSKILIC